MSDYDPAVADLVRRIEWRLSAALDGRLIDIATFELCRAALWRNLPLCEALLTKMYAKKADLDGCVPVLR